MIFSGRWGYETAELSRVSSSFVFFAIFLSFILALVGWGARFSRWLWMGQQNGQHLGCKDWDRSGLATLLVSLWGLFFRFPLFGVSTSLSSFFSNSTPFASTYTPCCIGRFNKFWDWFGLVGQVKAWQTDVWVGKGATLELHCAACLLRLA